ncbi:hypothetical protein ACO0LC_27335 [Undibacterium sp. JH2W]|uniref:hypothetical protein n=1 Tax=Undibacterium sp. JH2W TaxID=3413037 RepID=UPI003BEF5AC6
MSNTNSAVVDNFERGGGYGIPESELLYALRKTSNLVMLKIVSHAASLWSVLVSLFFWGPLLWSLILYPAFVILLLIIRNFVDVPNPVINQYAVLLAYVTGVWLTLRKQTPVQDYRTRKQHVGTKTLHLDFAQYLLIAEEVYRFFPKKNRLLTIDFKDLHAWVVWHEGDRAHRDDETCIDSVSVYIRLKRANAMTMAWASKKLGDPIFYHQYDKADAAQSAAAREKFDEVMALLGRHQIFQK